jgi:protein-tyrosine kinase
MSRIDQAMRRAGRPATTPSSSDGKDVFVSAWDPAPFPEPAKPAVEPPPSAPPATAEEAKSDQRLLTIGPHRLHSDAWVRLNAANRDDVFVEQFRRMAATLLHAQRTSNINLVMITSAVPGEGKTLTALNVARILSESYGRRVLLIDADLRRPRISQAVDLTVHDGLNEVLKAPDNRKVSVLQLTSGLSLLPAGRPDPDPLSGLTSKRMQQLLEEAASIFDWVIVDTPPIGAAPDAALISEMTDGVVLVVRAGQTRFAALNKAAEAIGRERILGVVLNGVEQSAVPYGDVSYYGNEEKN